VGDHLYEDTLSVVRTRWRGDQRRTVTKDPWTDRTPPREGSNR
jgi:hypothetical protein